MVGWANGVTDLVQHVLHVSAVRLPPRATQAHIRRLHQRVRKRHIAVIEVAGRCSNIAVEVELAWRNCAVSARTERFLLHF